MHQHGKWGTLAVIPRCILELAALCSIPVIAVSMLLMLLALVGQLMPCVYQERSVIFVRLLYEGVIARLINSTMYEVNLNG